MTCWIPSAGPPCCAGVDSVISEAGSAYNPILSPNDGVMRSLDFTKRESPSAADKENVENQLREHGSKQNNIARKSSGKYNLVGT